MIARYALIFFALFSVHVLAAEQGDIAYRVSSGSGPLQSGRISELPVTLSPATGDKLILETAAGALTQVDVGALLSEGGGQSIELRANATHIQWRYVGEPMWTDLIALSAITGAPGPKGDTGDPGPAGPTAVSANAGNAAVLGTDSLILVPVGTTAGTVAAGDDSRFSDARTPTAHAASHADGGADEISIDASQITSGSVPTARAPAGTYYEWIEIPLTPVGGTITASDLIVADVPYDGTITAARVACQTAPSVSAASIDLRRNAAWGSTPTTVLSAAISLGSGAFEASGTVSSGTVTAGDVLAGYVVQADGGGTAGDCILTISITRTAP